MKNLNNRHLEALLEIAKAITSDLYIDDILRLIVTITAEVMDSKVCSLLLLDEKKQELVIRATQSVSQEYIKKPSIKLGQGIAGLVAKENRPVVVEDVKKDERYINRCIAEKEGLCSLLSVPLCVKGKVIGVLNSYTSTPHRFTEREIKVLTTVANQAAIVIENAELMVQTKVIKEELETRKYVERAKGILMKQKGYSEQEAFRYIQKAGMDNRKTMREIAEAVIIASELEQKNRKKISKNT